MKTPIIEESLAEESKYSVALQEDEEDDELAAYKGRVLDAAQNDDEDDDFNDADFEAGSRKQTADWQAKCRELEAENREQAKTLNFQKAKIAALQTELEETLQQMAQKYDELS